jgi:hypothetical protein
LMNSAAVVVDTVSGSVVVANSTFSNISMANSNLLIVKKIPVLTVSNCTFNMLTSTSDSKIH